MAAQSRPIQLFRNLNAKIAPIPMILTTLVVFVGGTIWTVLYSFTNSKLLPRLQLRRPRPVRAAVVAPTAGWSRSRTWRSTASLSLIFSLVIGFLLAALLDQKIRFEDTFRTIFLYPFALSLHRHRPRLAVDPEPRLRHPDDRAQPRAGRASPSIRSTTPTS